MRGLLTMDGLNAAHFPERHLSQGICDDLFLTKLRFSRGKLLPLAYLQGLLGHEKED